MRLSCVSPLLALHCRSNAHVLLRRQVAGAFGVQAKLLTLDLQTLACPAIVLPHTSGVSHFWNDADNVAAAEAAFRDAIAQYLGRRSRFFS